MLQIIQPSPRTAVTQLVGLLFVGLMALPSPLWAGRATPTPGAVGPPPITSDITQTSFPPSKGGKIDPLRKGPKMSALEAKLSRERCERADHIVKQANDFRDESPLAVSYFKRALNLCPGHPEGNFRMGVISFHQKKTDAAIKSFKRSIKSNPNFVDGYFNLGIIYRKKNKPKIAKKYFTAGVKRDPQDALSYYNLGVLQYTALDRLRAQTSFIKAIAADPNLAEPHFFLGAMYQEQGERQKAKRELRKAIQLNSGLALPRVFLSAILETEGESQQAQRELDQAISIKPASVNVGYGLKEFYFNEGKSNAILTHIRKRKKIFSKSRLGRAIMAAKIRPSTMLPTKKSLPAQRKMAREERDIFGRAREAQEISTDHKALANRKMATKRNNSGARGIPSKPKPAHSRKPTALGTYQIRSGDTMAIVARRFRTTSAILMGLNTTRIEHPSVLNVGDVIRVPQKSKPRKLRRKRQKGRRRISKRRGRKRRGGRRLSSKRTSRRRTKRRRRQRKYQRYRIRRGDTFSKIARRFKTSAKTLMRLNRKTIEHPSFLEVGMRIRIPARRAKKRVRKRRQKRMLRRKRAVKKSRTRRTSKRNPRVRKKFGKKIVPQKRTSKKMPALRKKASKKKTNSRQKMPSARN